MTKALAKIILMIMLFAGIFAAPQISYADGGFFKRDEAPMTSWIKIRTEEGEDLLFNVELALTGSQQSKGLMGRTFMEKDAGMLFLFSKEDKRSFWMKNTLIPLDILFVAKDGEIHHIHHNARPQDLTSITSERPAFAVLEINGGMAEKLGVKEGDFIIHPAFKNAHLD